MKRNNTRKIMKGRGWFNSCRGKTCTAKSPERSKTQNFVVNNPMRNTPDKPSSPPRLVNSVKSASPNNTNGLTDDFIEDSKLSGFKTELANAKRSNNSTNVPLLEKIVNTGIMLQKVRKRINELKREKARIRAKTGKTNSDKERLISLAGMIEKFKDGYDKPYKKYEELIEEYENSLLSELNT